jgi:hypothetical protein
MSTSADLINREATQQLEETVEQHQNQTGADSLSGEVIAEVVNPENVTNVLEAGVTAVAGAEVAADVAETAGDIVSGLGSLFSSLFD